MARSLKSIADELTLSELKSLLKVKEEMTKLETQRARLSKEIAAVDGRLDKLRSSISGKPGVAKKRGRPAKAKPKKATKKTRTAKAKPAAAKGTSPKATVESVAVELIRGAGQPMSFQDILNAIVSGKLIATKSKNFANVLRRTLSASAKFKRVGRGVYSVKGVSAKAAAKKASPVKKATKKRKVAAAKKKTVAKAKTKKSVRGGTVEDVVCGLIKKNGSPMSFQDILTAIEKGKLVRSKSKNFANVLRRTMSTSERLKRAGRGIYKLA
jgi:hypothetical protein